jgi:SAM-dependent MidA family methyltransferase
MLRQEMEQHGGAITFDRFMELALYAPGLGYYTAGASKFGEEGDFVTAPEISPIFGRCLARQSSQILETIGGGDILEVGAGTGRLAADLLAELEQQGRLPKRYLILEVSPDLRQRQLQTLQQQVPQLLPQVEWLETLPESGFYGVVVANELLDAMPVNRFRMEGSSIREQFVEWGDDTLRRIWREPQSPGLEQAVANLGVELEEGYESEINMRAPSWLQEMAARLEAGGLLLIDYGYSRTEYYHPQRSAGTLMCHYRHRAHHDPLLYPGLQDITAHVDFTAIAERGQAVGLEVSGYTTQANFLIGCGLDQMVAEVDPNETARFLDMMQGVKRLTLPTEMGERFKVLALTKGVEQPLIGFGVRDWRERL